MASSTRGVGRLLASSVESAAGVGTIPMALIRDDERLALTLKGQTSIYSGVNKGKDREDLYSSYAYVRTKGRSGRYNNEEEAARAHDIVTLKCSGPKAILNFPASDYEEIMSLTRHMNDDELVAHIRRSGSRFARGSSKYRGVAKYSEYGRWFAHKTKKKEGQFLGIYDTEEEAAMAYDIETIKLKGWHAQTNFSLALYNVEAIQSGAANPEITAEIANYFKQATLYKPLGTMQPYPYYPNSSTFLLVQNYPSHKFDHILLPKVDESYYSLSHTVMNLLLPHPNFRDPTMASYTAKQGSVVSFNMFRHSSSSRFIPYKRE